MNGKLVSSFYTRPLTTAIFFIKHWVLHETLRGFHYAFLRGVLGKLKISLGVHFSPAKACFKRHFRILGASKDKTKSCWLCAPLLLQAAGLFVCFRVWHLPLGRENWHVSPFIAGWVPCAGGLYVIASWFYFLSGLGIQ